MSKKSKKLRIKTLTIIVLICFGLFLYKTGTYAYRLYTLNKLQKDLTVQYNDLRKQEKDLKVEIEKLKDDDYLARYVRQKYKYSKDGELVLSVDETKEVIDQMNHDINIYKVILMGSGGILAIVFIYVLFKKKR